MRHLCTLVITAVVLAGVNASASRHQAPNQSRPDQATLTLSGQVVDHQTGRPIAGAAVTIAGGPGLPDPPTVLADRNGRFTFSRLRPATVTLTATALGYLSGGTHSDDGMPPAEVRVDLASGTSVADLVVRLVKPASLSGFVLDDANSPVEGISLAAFREVYVAGYPRLAVAGSASPDDRGQYRVSRLAPGAYIVCGIAERVTLPRAWQEKLQNAAERGTLEQSAMRSLVVPGTSEAAFVVGDVMLRPGSPAMGPLATSDGRIWSAPNACNGNTPSPKGAPRIVLTSGEDHAGVDLRIDLQPSASLSGHVYGPSGPLAWQGLRLQPDGFEALGWADGVETASTFSDASGAFKFMGVPEGTYRLLAFNIPVSQRPGGPPSPDLPDGETLAAQQAIVIGREPVTGLEVRLLRGPRLSGRVVFNGASAAPDEAQLVKLALNVLQADGAAFRFPWARPRAVVAADASFRSTGLVRGRYLLEVMPLGEWQIESAMSNGVDISDQPFDASEEDLTNIVITMTDQVSTLSGTVRDDKGVGVRGGRVVVFPTDRSRWVGQGERPRRQRVADISQSGVYSLKGLPAGEYFVVATTSSDSTLWQTPEGFGSLSGEAQKTTLGARETRSLDLKVVER